MARIIFILFAFLLSGCIDPINYKYEEQASHFVVQAKFTNKEGPHIVRLSISRPFGAPNSATTIRNATVYVTSEEGEHYEFPFDPNVNLYINNSDRAEIGHTYRLHIVTPDEKVYQSEPVKMLDTVAIDALNFVYEEELSRDGKENLQGFNFMVDYTDPAESKNFYLWSYRAVYEVTTQPEDYLDYRFVPARNIPKSCCRICWINETGNPMIARNDILTNGQTVLGEKLFFLPFYKYMNKRLKLTIFQHSVSEQAFNFFSTLEKQRESTGSIFDPPPTQNQGNIFNTDDPNEFVIGYFDASATSEKEIIILPLDIPLVIKKYIFADDCRELDNATAIEPVGW